MNREIVPDLDENIAYIEKRFEGCADAVMRRLWMGDEKLEIYVIYMDSMYDRDFVDGVLLKSLLFDVSWLPERHAGQAIFNKYLATADVKEISRLDDLMDEVLKGNTGILAAGMSKAIVVSSKALPGRGVTEAETEVSVRGSKESFTESFRTNTVLIRRRIRDTRLKSKQMTIGVRSKTDVALMYMEDLVRPSVLREVLSRLESFEIDAILDSSYLEALTEDEWYSPFPQYQSTERPDKAASALLEGRALRELSKEQSHWWWIIRLWCLYFRLYLPVFFRHRMIIMTGGVQPILYGSCVMRRHWRQYFCRDFILLWPVFTRRLCP